ncbi:MAG: type III-B CRISPR module RAMP protein Cmr1 [Microcoleus sp. PH2017_10_PVI_O_A]|uniref:type III-B CRISPR module RAMP protein Cmr1 n=1 Tax=unclassified Microcoleus TaxID=2642155 RepID=UPI001D851F0F|nr:MULTISPECIES: type III-B CRISPR module RAMP protein Cmr1 [unclassified Microcoleus]TAF19799.1 MAG: type III-B CRISPR module RAMP protein Cmr1 [Oscillatoriales cyanobacterium]MCC3406754.1 type III-B CRISPR module RAMP protein Cmr1 [Microcoleus sp. PH2017_10_PVI_O_A]MCC3460890.1 type III-B CRISPR module RAMP protein Cmr1 [Microcoleus sp. PH2017_11_PCY_U_A]MCC3479411.1 type III-B CRISPR module RAMP protein Cmr1 [Microcoleus sp. PH2017_12_PCY_D_A]MCC3560253.1 type III-B CRISPR module RAMP prote
MINRNNQNRNDRGGGQTPQQMWSNFLQKLRQDKNPLYDLLQNSELTAADNLIVYVPDGEVQKQAKSKLGRVTAKLFELYPQWNKKKLFFEVGNLPQTAAIPEQQNPPRNGAATPARIQQAAAGNAAIARQQTLRSPLQALNLEKFEKSYRPALEAAVAAETTCDRLYQQLTEKTKLIATEVLTVEFPWRVRVGGTRGFQEILLPVFHPVYGVPYVPSSSIKGAVLAWARQNNQSGIDRLLGALDNGIGCVQFLDAFPTKPCLSIDLANPNWHWDADRIKYKPEPHFLLSMEQPELAIGLALTSRGNNQNDVKIVKEWLEKTLAESGIGSRVSSGYGRTKLAVISSNHGVLTTSYKFDLWTAGMYGAFAPNKKDRQGTPEFRPTAVRGMLRYWFRAIALGIYPLQQCKTLEAELFGTIEPRSQVGAIRIAVEWQEKQAGNRSRPFHYSGTIHLEARQTNRLPLIEKNLQLIEKILQLSSYLGGIGRGSRRPLHWNNPEPGLRGCYWELETNQLPCKERDWQNFLRGVRGAFLEVQQPTGNPATCPPGKSGDRNQDVLNGQSKIYLVPFSDLLHPRNVKSWNPEGIEVDVRGEALELLYAPRFKGVNQQNIGNKNVGGCITKENDNESTSTPSYVIIKSNFPQEGRHYQAVTIFGANHPDRANFVQALPRGSIKVWPLPQTQ